MKNLALAVLAFCALALAVPARGASLTPIFTKSGLMYRSGVNPSYYWLLWPEADSTLLRTGNCSRLYATVTIRRAYYTTVTGDTAVAATADSLVSFAFSLRELAEYRAVDSLATDLGLSPTDSATVQRSDSSTAVIRPSYYGSTTALAWNEKALTLTSAQAVGAVNTTYAGWARGRRIEFRNPATKEWYRMPYALLTWRALAVSGYASVISYRLNVYCLGD